MQPNDENPPRRSYLKEFYEEISNLPNKDKMAQIGIEPSVLGIPKENISLAKVKSYFIDVPYDTTEPIRIPKQWIDISNLESPIKLIPLMPDLTLFFIFYSQPHDLAQITASEELQNRGWNYDEIEAKWTCENETDTFEFDLHSWCIKKKAQ